MGRFLFVVPPLAGHVNPTVPVAAELASRGHRVAWCGHASVIAPLLPAGAEVLATDETLPASELDSIVARSHGEDAARTAEEHFTRVVRRHEAPDDVPEVPLPAGDPVHLPALLVSSFGVGSTSEARRLIDQGGVKIAGEPVSELDVARKRLSGALVQVGKRRFGRLTEG